MLGIATATAWTTGVLSIRRAGQALIPPHAISFMRTLGPSSDFPKDDLSVGIAALVDAGYIATGPHEAATRIEARYGCELTEDGTACKAISSLRSAVSQVDPHLATALTITAPHTHWQRGDVIVEQYDRSRDVYILGPSQALPHRVTSPLTPMSFVLHPDGPTAYEWTDASTGLASQVDLERLWRGLRQVNDLVLDNLNDSSPLLLGVSTSHRFKSLWEAPTAGTSERPDPENEHLAFVSRAYGPPDPDPSRVQVGWSAFVHEEFTDDEKRALEVLEGHLATLTESEAAEFLENLERVARRGSDAPETRANL